MTEAEIAKLATWLAKAGLEGRTETALVEGFCSRAVAAGLPLARVMMLVDTLHPIHEGRAFRWEKEKPEVTLTEYGRTGEGEAAERWRTSPLYRLFNSRDSVLRLRVTAEAEAEFPSFAEFREAKFTDYVAIINRFAEDGAIGEMDCVYSYWTTDRADGFSDDELGAL
jgi:adenylate cyclase